jgi:hypothetical protein
MKIAIKNSNPCFKIYLAILLLIYLSGCELNLLGGTRFSVDSQVYGLVGVEESLPGQEGSYVRIWLSRVLGPTQENDAEIISQVNGIVIVNPENARIGVSEVGYDGSVSILFETNNHSGPWTLLWPEHKPVLITS